MEYPEVQEMWDTVTSRLLSESERPYRAGDPEVPLVIEPKPGILQKQAFLCEFLATHSESIIHAIYKHGAILLRGFEIVDDWEFAQVSRSIKGLQPMDGYFMPEQGRLPLKGSTSLFHTNRYRKTGGSFKLIGGFHGENYITPDVPAFQSLWCRIEPRMGGETGLVHMANVYDELEGPLQARLEQKVYDAAAIPVSAIARCYAMPEHAVETVCFEVGLPIVSQNGHKYAMVRKPSVFRHPYTKRRSLQISPSFMVPAFDTELRKHVEPRYRALGWKWTLHNWGWRTPSVYRMLLRLEALEVIVSDPAVLWIRLRSTSDRPDMSHKAKPEPSLEGIDRVASALSHEDIEALARSMSNHISVFTWRRGDVLIWDNVTMNHAGMPGVGRRSLIATLYDPIPLNLGVAGSGLADIPFPDRDYESVETRFRRASQLLESGESTQESSMAVR